MALMSVEKVGAMLAMALLAAVAGGGQLSSATTAGGGSAAIVCEPAEYENAASTQSAAMPMPVPKHGWRTVQTFTFDYDNASIRATDLTKAIDISARVGGNASLRIGVDGSTNPRGIGPYSQGLRDRRVEVVRETLIGAGVPDYLIETGTFSSSRATDARSVDVLLRISEQCAMDRAVAPDDWRARA